MSKTKPGSVKDALFGSLRKLSETHLYFTFDRIKETVQQANVVDSIPTLKDYLTEAVDKGILYDAGKGWYSGVGDPLPLDTKSVEPVSEILSKKFPLLPICCWSTAQLNPYLEHLMGMSMTFVFVEADALSSIEEYLRGAGLKVAENPRGEAQKRLRLEDNLVILRPGSLWQDYMEGPHAPWEVLLVQAYQEVERLGFIDRGEYQEAVNRAMERGTIQIASLIAYARKSKIPLKNILKNDRLSENI